MVEEGTGGDKVVEARGVAGSDGEKAGETREIVEVEDAPTDEDEEKAVEMEQCREMCRKLSKLRYL